MAQPASGNPAVLEVWPFLETNRASVPGVDSISCRPLAGPIRKTAVERASA